MPEKEKPWQLQEPELEHRALTAQPLSSVDLGLEQLPDSKPEEGSQPARPIAALAEDTAAPAVVQFTGVEADVCSLSKFCLLHGSLQPSHTLCCRSMQGSYSGNAICTWYVLEPCSILGSRPLS